MANIYTEIKRYTHRHKKRKTWHKVLWVLSCITVFCTTYALILPAISQEGAVYCGKTEHTHSIEGGCYSEELICGLEESEDHHHSEACYELICTQKEHTHSLVCNSNPDADVETAEDWEKTFADVELTDDLSANLTAIARSQLDYAESEDNYAVETDPDTGEETTKGYTRYGAWYTDWYAENHPDSETVDFTYENWSAMFASFCLHYAGITEEMIPYEESCARWVETLTELGQFYTPAEDSPCVGDLVFFDSDRDGTTDHVGIVTGYTYVDDDESKDVNGITTIEGNSGDKVAEQKYSLDCEDICGYGYFVEENGIAVALDSGTEYSADSLISVANNAVGKQVSTLVSVGDGQDQSAVFVSYCLQQARVAESDFPRATTCSAWVSLLQSDSWGDGYWAVRDNYVPKPGDLIFFNDGTVGIIIADKQYGGNSKDHEFTIVEVNSDGIITSTDYGFWDGKYPDTSWQHVWENKKNTTDNSFIGYGITPFAAEQPDEPSAEWTLFSEGESITANLYQCTYDSTVTDRNKTHYIPGVPATFTISGAAYKRTSSKTVGGTTYQYHEYLIPLETVLNQYSSLSVNTGVDLSTVQENDASPFMSGRSKETFTGNVMKGNATTGNMWDSKYPDEIANALTAGNYVLKDGMWYLQVRATETEGQSDVLDIYYAVLEQEPNTVSPSSSAINIFDYWIDSRDARDIFSYADAGINSGHAIKFFWSNNDVSIKEGSTTNTGVINTSTQEYNNGVVQGIVQNKLVNGYPVLSGDLQNGGNSKESLAYLFDPKTVCEYRTAYTNVKGLLQANGGYYYFDAEDNAAEYDESTNRMNLYTHPVMAAGGDSPYGQFFPFEDAHQAALESSVCDDVQHYFGMALTAKFIQQHGGTNDGEPVTFEFTGDDDVWIFIDDVLVADLGGVHSQCGVTINFSDGKIEIIGVQGVSADGMSITDSRTVTTTTLKSQFETALGSENLDASDWSGNTFADDTTHTLKFFYLERGNWDSSLSLRYNLVDAPPTSIYKVDQYGKALVGATFATYAAEKVTDADGNVTAYKYKMDDGSASQTWQTDWYLDTATGNVYASKTAYNNGEIPIITATYHGTTDNNGEMQFVDEYGGPFTEKELKQTLTGDVKGGSFILREISIPDGYRTVSAETWLTFSGSNIICDNTYQSGVWASPNALVTATNELHVASAYKDKASTMTYVDGTTSILNNSGNIDYYNVNDGSKGTLFAVVLKRDGNSLYDIDKWDPLYGNDVDGYTVLEDGNETNNLVNAIAAAQAQQANPNDHSVVFTESASGMQALLEDLPGKITRYYTYMQEQGTLTENDNPDKDPQYFVAYYWTTETITNLDDWNKVTTDNTVRVVSRSGIETGYDGFDIQWGTTLEVPNMENRLFFQKLNEDGALVDGAVFALYEAYDAWSSQDQVNYVYYIGTDSATNDPSGQKVYVGILSSDGKDSDGNPIQSNAIPGNSGAAIVFREITKEDGTVGAELIGRGIYEINTTGVSVNPTEGTVTGTDIGLITITNVKDSSGNAVEGTWYVHPATNAKDETLVGATHDTCEYVTEVGTGHFIQLASGKYYLREIYAPEGYVLNTTDIPVLVNNNGVYANALEAGDGVAVGNGTGYLTKTLDVFASPGEIDETLTWVYAALLQNTTTGFAAFDEVSGDVIRIDNENSWSFVTKSKTSEEPAGYGDGTSKTRDDAMLTYLIYDGKLASKKQQELIFDYVLNTGHTDGEQRLRLYTDEGWSDLAIYQDYDYGYANRSNKSSGDTAANTTYYEKLTSLGNISNLFSSSTFVQVTDQADGMVDLAIEKTDSSGQPLAGASFRLMQETEKDDGFYVYDAATQTTTWVKNAASATVVESDANGVCNFHGLKAGTYYLEEISPPAGYLARTETIKVVVTSVTKSTGMELVMVENSEATGIKPKDTVQEGENVGAWLGILVDANDKEVTENNPLTGDDTGHYRYTLIIPNNKDYRLPETGGMGTGLFYLTGVLLILGAGVLLVNRKRGCR